MQTKNDVLKACTVEGTIVKLPGVQLDRKLYVDVKKALELIGGKWKGGNVQGFVFNEAPGNLLAQISIGTKVNIQKDYQFFWSPDSLCDRMVQMAYLEEYDLVLEPSAGQGAIIKAIQRTGFKGLIHYCELMPLNRTFLERIPDTAYITDNFLKLGRSKITTGVFDKIIANPPFSQDQDVDHILQMWDCLKPGGRIVTVSGKSWQYTSKKKAVKFRQFIEDVNAEIETIPAGTFKEAGTNIETLLLTIDKPL